MSYDRRKVLKALEKQGFVFFREGGRHTIVRGPNGQTIAIPRHRELNRFTVKGIAEDSGAEWAKFKKELS